MIQRAREASVIIDGALYSGIGPGRLILVGVETGDTYEDAEWLAAKTASMRIFPDENGVMNRSLTDISSEALAVSQFTLTASTRKGNRPSYIRAARYFWPFFVTDYSTLSCLKALEYRNPKNFATGIFLKDSYLLSSYQKLIDICGF